MTIIKTCHAMDANVTLMAEYLDHAGEAVEVARRALDRGDPHAAIGALLALDPWLDATKQLRQVALTIHRDRHLFDNP